MNKKVCPKCGSSNTKKNGTRNGVQLYKCLACKHQFRCGNFEHSADLWNAYQNHKQTIQQIADLHHISTSSVKRKLRSIEHKWQQPNIAGLSGYVHLDVTYWGHQWGVLLALDDATGKPLYLAFTKSETIQDFRTAIDDITTAGYTTRGLVVDGKKALFKEFKEYPIQMCQFHMVQIIRRYLTNNPKTKAAIDLMLLMREMKYMDKERFEARFAAWKEQYDEFLNKRKTHKDGKVCYLHRRMRTAMHSIEGYLPYLFTYRNPELNGMPNTNNKIEGTFSE